MKIAVCSKDFIHISGHAGQARHWLLFELPDSPRLPAREQWRVAQVELAKAQTFHHFKDDGPHPLEGISVLIAISSGESFIKRMQKAEVEAVMTAERDPYKAVQDYLEQQLAPPKPRPIGELFCKIRDVFSENK